MRKPEIRFVKTCERCPEQYDAYDSCGHNIGYLRLRWGVFTVYALEWRNNNCIEKLIYRREYASCLAGEFLSQKERHKQLRKAQEALIRCREEGKQTCCI